MLEKELAKNVPIEERADYLNNICDGTESMSYARQFTPEEMAEHRELLSNACIMLEDIEREKKSALTRFKDKAKQYEVQRKQAVDNLRMKSEVVEEECFKILDEETKMVGFYNSLGDLVNSRPALPKELQKSLFAIRKTGTEN